MASRTVTERKARWPGAPVPKGAADEALGVDVDGEVGVVTGRARQAPAGASDFDGVLVGLGRAREAPGRAGDVAFGGVVVDLDRAGEAPARASLVGSGNTRRAGAGGEAGGDDDQADHDLPAETFKDVAR